MDPDGRDLEGFVTKLANLHNLRIAAHRIVTGAIESGSRFVLSEEIVKALHRTCMVGLIDEAGDFRKGPVTLGNSPHVPPHHSEIGTYMKQFYQYVNDEWDHKDPIHLAAFTLWRMLWVHPFLNGNGRTSRELSYVVLNVRIGYLLPSKNSIVEQVSQSAQNRSAYGNALRSADSIYAGTSNFDACLRPMEELLAALLKEQLKANLD